MRPHAHPPCAAPGDLGDECDADLGAEGQCPPGWCAVCNLCDGAGLTAALRKYAWKIEHDASTGRWIAICPALFATASGATEAEVKLEIDNVLDDLAGYMAERDIAPPITDSVKIRP